MNVHLSTQNTEENAGLEVMTFSIDYKMRVKLIG